VVENGNELAAIPEGLATYPAHRVIALLPDVGAAAAAVEDLSAAGFERDQIAVFLRQAGPPRLDATGRRHELRSRLYRLVWRLGDEYEAFTRTVDHLQSGGPAIRVATDEKRKVDAARILRLHGSILTVYFGLLHFEDLGSRFDRDSA
jgi:hypothetical protein